MLTEHFAVKEFECKCGCGQIKVDPILLIKLELLRQYIDTPIIVNSGYRCTVHNKNVGGVENSLHLKGKAADITVSNKDKFLELVYWAGYVFKNNGVGYYPNFVHVDTGAKRVFRGK